MAGRGWDGAGCPLPRQGCARCPDRAVPAQPCHPAETVAALNRSYQEQNLPVTDGSRELHSLCAQLEFLLQVPPFLPLPASVCPGSQLRAEGTPHWLFQGVG